MFIYIASFGATWLPLPWLYPAEISPINTRAKANAISTCTNWLFNFLIVMVTPIMIRNIKWGTYVFFACINACFFPVIYFFYPETAGRSLEEIDLIFANGFCEGLTMFVWRRNCLTSLMRRLNRLRCSTGLCLVLLVLTPATTRVGEMS